MRKRPLTLSYIIFYLLFSPDTWRILMGVIAAVIIVPLIAKPDMGLGARAVLFIMLATIGYTATGVPGRWIAQFFKKLILGDKLPKK